ncbi:unnamed protein product [Onchocerca flexuosa]|uniref:Glyco_hydro_18 domain-containing protein n=1 Tax=Onchocerca flexuosa TaxID=387005 RepID=A0A183GXT3_9BILA|nr:unnamed protein product [Onchocerca flexuosa]
MVVWSVEEFYCCIGRSHFRRCQRRTNVMVVLSRCVRTSLSLLSNLKIAVPRTEELIIDRYYHYWGYPKDKNDINFVPFAVNKSTDFY